MIRGFEPKHQLDPEFDGIIQWPAALGAGLIAGLVLLIVPHGSPWSSITIFSHIILGRAQPPGVEMRLPVVWSLHLGISIVYGLMISVCLTRLRRARGVVVGGLLGLVLYFINLAAVTLLFPEWRGNEWSVLFTHVVFGLLVGGAYRGLLRRTAGIGEKAFAR